MNEEHEEHGDDVIVLVNSQGDEQEYYLYDVFTVDEQRYAVLVPTDEDSEDGVIMRLDEDEDSEYLTDIDDEDEWEQVVAKYENMFEEDERRRLENELR